MNVAQTAVAVPQKRWARILPPAVLVYIFSYMDRGNIGIAMVGGMNKELHLSASVAGTAAGIFFIGYLVLQMPAGHVAARGRAKAFISGAVITWGLAAMLTGFVQNAWQLTLLRFFLGVAEGGTFPAMLALIANWFPAHERARANAIFMMSSSVGYMITSPISGWIISLWGWRHVFIIEGIFTIAMVLIWHPLVKDKPEEAKWLSPEERDYLVAMANEERESVHASNKGDVSARDVLSKFDLWRLALIYFSYQVGVTAFGIWLPTLVKELTKTGIGATGILSGIPFGAAMFGVYIFGAFSDRSGNRRFWAAFPGLCFGLCYLLSAQTKTNVWVSYAFLIGCGFFYQAHNGVFWTIPPILFGKEQSGFARGLINGVGNLGGFLGPFLVGWFITRFHNSDYGLYGLSFFLVLAFAVALTLPAKTAKKETKVQALKAPARS